MMRVVGFILAASVVLAVLRAATVVMLIAAALALAICLFQRPRETIGLAILITVTAQPILLVAVLAALLFAKAILALSRRAGQASRVRKTQCERIPKIGTDGR